MKPKIYYSKGVNLEETKQIMKEIGIGIYSLIEYGTNQILEKDQINILIYEGSIEKKEMEKFGIQNTINLSEVGEKKLIKKYEEIMNLEPEIKIKITTFGFKYGKIPNTNFVFDVRFLKNPYYVEELREKTGLEEEVSKYVFEDGKAQEYVEKTVEYLKYQIPLHKENGRRKVEIGIACTGGKHRSVSVSEAIKKELEKKYKTEIFHRDIRKE